MEKYLILYTEEESRNCQRFDVTKTKHFDSFSEAMDYIAYMEAFGKSYDCSFDCLLEVKELHIERPEAKIKELREKRKREEAEQKQKNIDQQESREKAQLERLKAKYESKE